ncbi:type VI secretion system tip protein VgrG [Tropicimonas sp. TH_r6]|uniref:type VI secretion system tip protein VgrG n=1 Tax=Tropicimonas sp. TH_r6 TaxID=3082085 RepID=UPI002955549F|nr:type VI secretion system tip protein VgrG [Tropicimonas sp. TH_r6]MDV7144031.1 type VI secretion system tip protein VgrG [Tropicimonas sp. TH_r6]
MLLDLTQQDSSTPSFSILVDGTDISEDLSLISLEICRALDRIPYAQLVLRDGDAATQTFELSEGPLLPPGAPIELLLGYNQADETVFKGTITRQRLDAPLGGSTRLLIEAKHDAFKMAHARKSRVWQEVTDADALAEIADAHGLGFDGLTPVTRPSLVQHQATDWDFMVMRAQMVGQAVLAADDGLQLVVPGPAAPEATVAYGADVFALEMELDAERQPASVQSGAWTAADAAVTTAESEGPPFVGPGNTDYGALGEIGGDDPHERTSGARDQAELDDWAGATGVRRRLSAVRGVLEVQGKATYQPGMTIQLEGMGARFNGPAYVAGVRHQFSRGDFRTFLQVGIEPEFHRERVDVEAPAAAGLLPGIRGLQIGTVDALEGDPAGEERVAVLLATDTETAETVWARPLSIGGGAERGLVLLPEIGDEVLLGFLDGDPRDPMLLGGLHSSASASPYPGADDNHVKGLASRAGMKISFDDDTVALTLETPGGHKLVLDDDAGSVLIEDSNGNTVELSSDGVSVSAQGDLTLGATGDINLEGTNISIAANAEVKAEGSAGAKLLSSGQTTIEGSLVTIN